MSDSSVIWSLMINVIKLGFFGNVQKCLQLLQFFNFPHITRNCWIWRIDPIIQNSWHVCEIHSFVIMPWYFCFCPMVIFFSNNSLLSFFPVWGKWKNLIHDEKGNVYSSFEIIFICLFSNINRINEWILVRGFYVL